MAMLVPAISLFVALRTAAQTGITAAAYPSSAKWCSAIQNESSPASSAMRAWRRMSAYSSRWVYGESGGSCALYMPMPKRIGSGARSAPCRHVGERRHDRGQQQQGDAGQCVRDAAPVGDRARTERAEVADSQ